MDTCTRLITMRKTDREDGVNNTLYLTFEAHIIASFYYFN